MRRAAVATAATVVGLIALLDYRSSSPSARTRVSVGGGQGAGSGGGQGTVPPTTAPPSPTSTGGATTAPPATGGPATSPATAPPTTAATAATYTGRDIQYQYGDIVVRITVRGGRITDVTVPQESATDPRSESINSQAVPILVQEALQAQSLNFDVVSGATYTSDAFAASLQVALQQAGRA